MKRFWHWLFCGSGDWYRRHNPYGIWLVCAECGWESDGWLLRPYPAVVSRDRPGCPRSAAQPR